jgi:hypothetical protein
MSTAVNGPGKLTCLDPALPGWLQEQAESKKVEQAAQISQTPQIILITLNPR